MVIKEKPRIFGAFLLYIIKINYKYFVISGDIGLTAERKRCIRLPFSSIRNFSKFHLISPVKSGFWVVVKYLNNGSISSPLTLTLPLIGKVTLKFSWQKVFMSWLLPGSCPPKL